MTKGPILVVDDDKFIRETLVAVLEDEGYGVQVAEHGAEALALMEAAPPRVVLLDLRMPVMDGWTFAREVRARGYTAPIIVLTAAQALPRETEHVEADAIMEKPFDIEELINQIEQLCAAP